MLMLLLLLLLLLLLTGTQGMPLLQPWLQARRLHLVGIHL
jgi:hypothetical protein